MKTLQKVLVAVAVLGMLAAAGCEKPLDLSMQRNRIFLMGRLLAGKTCDVRLIWRKAPEDQAPVRVTADLSEIGGGAEQELSTEGNNIWRWSGQVTPESFGEKLVRIVASFQDGSEQIIEKMFQVHDTEKAVAIGAGRLHFLAVKADGAVAAWNCPEDIRDLGQCDVPGNLTDVVAVAGGGSHSLALKADGTVSAWGEYGEDMYSSSPELRATVPDGLSDVVAISAKYFYNAALKADGTVAVWGKCREQCNTPNGLTDVVAIATGSYNIFALRADGSVASWKAEGASLEYTNLPINNAVAIASSSDLVLNEYGRIVSADNNNLPVRADRRYKAVSGYTNIGIAIQNDGTVISWRYNCGFSKCYWYVNEGPRNIIAIAAGTYYGLCMALAADGSVKTWRPEWYNDEQPVPRELQ